MKNILALFVALVLSFNASAAQSKNSFGGTSKSTVTSGGVSKNSFGGASKSTPTTSYTDRSSLPTRTTVVPKTTYVTPPSTPAVTTTHNNGFGGVTKTPTVVVAPTKPNTGFGGVTQTPPTQTKTTGGFGGVTASNDRSSLPTRNWQPTKPTVAVQSPADIALTTRAKTSGTFYNNRNDAFNSFKNRYNTTYTYHYNVQPTIWPTHIPRTYTYGGSNYNITFNPSFGEYGYWYTGSWHHYDPFDDVTMLDVLMRQHDYYYTPPVIYTTTPTNYTPTYQQPYQQPVIVNAGPPPSLGSVLTVIAVLFGIVIVIAVIANIANKGSY